VSGMGGQGCAGMGGHRGVLEWEVTGVCWNGRSQGCAGMGGHRGVLASEVKFLSTLFQLFLMLSEVSYMTDMLVTRPNMLMTTQWN